MSTPAGSPLPVVTTVAEAQALVAAGNQVVVVVPPEELAGVTGLLEEAVGLSAVLVGDPDDPAVVAAAAEMAAELGARPAPRADPGGG